MRENRQDIRRSFPHAQIPHNVSRSHRVILEHAVICGIQNRGAECLGLSNHLREKKLFLKSGNQVQGDRIGNNCNQAHSQGYSES